MRVTKASLTELITRSDAVAPHAAGRALVHLLNKPTREEQRNNTIENIDRMRFTPTD